MRPTLPNLSMNSIARRLRPQLLNNRIPLSPIAGQIDIQILLNNSLMNAKLTDSRTHLTRSQTSRISQHQNRLQINKTNRSHVRPPRPMSATTNLRNNIRIPNRLNPTRLPQQQRNPLPIMRSQPKRLRTNTRHARQKDQSTRNLLHNGRHMLITRYYSLTG